MAGTLGVIVREEAPGDVDAVHAVNVDAFETDEEARLVDGLRPFEPPEFTLVAELDGDVVGAITFARVTVSGTAGDWSAMGLAPLAVRSEHQNRGIGSALTRAGLERCRSEGEAIVFVLGHPGYYPRFGFELAAPRGLAYWQRGAEQAFFVAELLPGALANRDGEVRYRFEDVGS